LVGLAYQAALQPGEWENFLCALAEQTDSAVAGIHWTDKSNGSPVFVADTGLRGEGKKEYSEHFAKTCPRFQAAFRLRPGAVFVDYDVISEREMNRHELYEDFLPRQGLRYVAGIVAINDETQHCGFGAQRSRRQGHFEGADLDLVRQVAPHVVRAVQMQKHLQTLSTATDSLTAALDGLRLGVIFVDAVGRPVVMNRAAEAILAEGDGLTSARRQLVAATASATAALGRAINAAAATSAGEGLEPGRAMTLPRPSGERALEVIVSPVPRNDERIGVADVAAALIVSDPNSAPNLPLETLRRLYGLTPAEANVAAALAQGHSLREYAEQTGRRVQTVRKTTKKVFAKTETTRQAELVARLLKGPAGFASSDPDDA
jgi:DNA-binding CsgD family transcriptional regulator